MEWIRLCSRCWRLKSTLLRPFERHTKDRLLKLKSWVTTCWLSRWRTTFLPWNASNVNTWMHHDAPNINRCKSYSTPTPPAVFLSFNLVMVRVFKRKHENNGTHIEIHRDPCPVPTAGGLTFDWNRTIYDIWGQTCTYMCKCKHAHKERERETETKRQCQESTRNVSRVIAIINNIMYACTWIYIYIHIFNYMCVYRYTHICIFEHEHVYLIKLWIRILFDNICMYLKTSIHIKLYCKVYEPHTSTTQ